MKQIRLYRKCISYAEQMNTDEYIKRGAYQRKCISYAHIILQLTQQVDPKQHHETTYMDRTKLIMNLDTVHGNYHHS